MELKAELEIILLFIICLNRWHRFQPEKLGRHFKPLKLPQRMPDKSFYSCFCAVEKSVVGNVVVLRATHSC